MNAGPLDDLSFLDAGRETRQRDHQTRARMAMAVSATVTITWLAYVTGWGHWDRVADRWLAALTMVFGSFVAGSTPQGGGAVAFPVFTKVLDVPAEVARSFSLLIQTVGMGCAAAAIVITRRPVDWTTVRIVAPLAVVTLVVATLAIGESDQAFWPSSIPGAYVKVTFTLVVAAMAWVVHLGRKVPIRTRTMGLPSDNRRLRVALVASGVAGGLASALVGSGADVAVYLFLVVLFGVDSRAAIPTSVVVMAIVSAAGFVLFGAIDGQLSIGLGNSGADVVSIGGDPLAAPLEASRFDLFGLWLAAVPVVAWGAPLGSWAADRASPQLLIGFVIVLAAVETLSTIVFLDELHTSPVLALYGAAGLAVVAVGLWWLAENRQRIFDLPGIDTQRSFSRADLDVAGHYRRALDPESLNPESPNPVSPDPGEDRP